MRILRAFHGFFPGRPAACRCGKRPTARRKIALGVEMLESRELMATGLTASLGSADYVPGGVQANLIQIVNNAGQTHIDASGLSGTYFAVDNIAHDPTAPFDVALAPGQHFFNAYGVTTTYFSVADNGVVDYDPALEGILTGRGTNALSIHGAAVQIDASALSEPNLVLDYASHDPAMPFTVNLLPGDHLFYTYGSTYTWFKVAANGTIDYDPALEGVLTGRGTNALGIHGATIQVDASALSEGFHLDYVAHDPATTFSATLLPGDHVLNGFDSTATSFTMAADGTVSYDASLAGALTGQGTHALGIQGRGVFVNAAALGASSSVSLDNIAHAIDQPFSAQLLPGQHLVSYDGKTAWFGVGADGTITTDAALAGILKTPIAEKYAALANAPQLLGNATGGELPTGADGGLYQLYELGGIYYSPTTGAHVLTGDFFQEYQDNGGPTGPLGLPTMDLAQAGNGVQYVNFQNGAIVSSGLSIRTFVGDTFTPSVADQNIAYEDIVVNNRDPIGSWLGHDVTLPKLSSDPNAPTTVYLNFTGDYLSSWFGYAMDGTKVQPFQNITIPVFHTDYNAPYFSLGEQDFIRNIWERVAEDFSPFNINVTTINPGKAASSKTMQVDIGGLDFRVGKSSSGTSGFESYTKDSPHVVFVFTSEFLSQRPDDGLYSNQRANQVASSAAHEVGHAFGLDHDRVYDENDPNWKLVNEYDPGDGITTPIMGDNLSFLRHTWSDGNIGVGTLTDGEDTLHYYIKQDDLNVIGSAGNKDPNLGTVTWFGRRVDNYGHTLATATPLPVQVLPGSISAKGIIVDRTDVDAFSFTTGAGTVSIRLDTIRRGATLHGRIELWSDNGMIAADDRDDRLGAAITASLAAGKYYVKVMSHGGYGDIGQYTLTVNPVFTRQEYDPYPAGDTVVPLPSAALQQLASSLTADTVVPPPSGALQQLASSMTANAQPLTADAPVPVPGDQVPVASGLVDPYPLYTPDTQTLASLASTAPVETSALDPLFMTDFQLL
jgi:hypothetical protein